MIKTKLFTGRFETGCKHADDEFNKWFKNNQDIGIIDIRYCEGHNNHHSILVLYDDNADNDIFCINVSNEKNSNDKEKRYLSIENGLDMHEIENDYINDALYRMINRHREMVRAKLINKESLDNLLRAEGTMKWIEDLSFIFKRESDEIKQMFIDAWNK